MQLVSEHCSRTSWKAMLRVLPTTFKPVLQQISLLQVAWILTSDWTRLRGSHAIDGSCVTCCKTSSSWAGKTRDMYRFCCKKVELLATFCTIYSQPATTRFVGRQVWTANKTNCLSWENSLADWYMQYKQHVAKVGSSVKWVTWDL